MGRYVLNKQAYPVFMDSYWQCFECGQIKLTPCGFATGTICKVCYYRGLDIE